MENVLVPLLSRMHWNNRSHTDAGSLAAPAPPSQIEFASLRLVVQRNLQEIRAEVRSVLGRILHRAGRFALRIGNQDLAQVMNVLEIHCTRLSAGLAAARRGRFARTLWILGERNPHRRPGTVGGTPDRDSRLG